MAEEKIEKFQPTNGRLVGVLGLTVVLGLMVVGAVDRYPVWGSRPPCRGRRADLGGGAASQCADRR